MAWNGLRTKAVEKALTCLYATFAKEVHERLLKEAKDYVKLCVRKKLYDWLAIAPIETYFRQQLADQEEEGEWSLDDGVRVMAIAFESSM